MGRIDSKVEYSISLQDVKKVFNNLTVVDEVNLNIKPGEFVSLLGPSGSGKTTILRMIAGLETIDGGILYINGENANNIPVNKRNLGMVFQQYALFPHMTVWENVAYGLKNKKIKGQELKSKVEKYLKLVELDHLHDRKPKQLSGGQQQRVSLARALAVEPIVLLFDEPLSNLDVRLKEQMLKEIHDLHQRLGFTAIYVTHDQKEALFLSDKIAVINEGKIQQFAKPEEIIRKPKTEFVAKFMGYTNCIENAKLINKNIAKIDNLRIPLSYASPNSKINDKGKVYLRDSAIEVLNDENNNGEEFVSTAYVKGGRYLGSQLELEIVFTSESNNSINVLLQDTLLPIPEINKKIKIKFKPNNIIFLND